MLDYLRMWLAVRVRSERGASAVEYGLLVAGVLVACIFAFEVLGLTVRTLFSATNSDIQEP
jgi:Flp pilus assembly pilin Flp